MTIRDSRREAAIERMADYLLSVGMAGASLRPLAEAAGTSNRMLLYYFDNRDELITAVLERVALRLTTMLDGALPPGVRLAYAPLLGAVWAAVGSPPLRSYMRLWLELTAGSARGRFPDQAIAAGIMAGFVEWTRDHLEVAPGGDHDAAAALLLATVEGLLFLDAVGRRDVADAAAAAVR